MKISRYLIGLSLFLAVTLSGEMEIVAHADRSVSRYTPEEVVQPSKTLRVSARGGHAHKIYLVFDLADLSEDALDDLENASVSLNTRVEDYLLGEPAGLTPISVYGLTSDIDDPTLSAITWENAPANDANNPSLLERGKATLLATTQVDTSTLKGDEAVVWSDERLVKMIQKVGSDRTGSRYLTLIIVSEGMVDDAGVIFFSEKGTSLMKREPKLVLEF
ncbi:hypothetical protein [Cerasicoccus fimbriatus]|uniref:hypothetical protein n=1 Tax=Cerasicoccus fimbriatus TaxID=3014554 RepID=UPI0022B4F6EC|nr:hypothetical protein [Cerasicoccus sp. TK19100]